MQYKRMTRREWIATAAVPVLLRGADPVAEEKDFEPIFDGRTLQGWSVRNGPESAFFVEDGAIVIHEGSGFPTWLRFDRSLENFEFRCEFFIQGWANSGIYLHAPEHGRPTECGMKINLFQKQDEIPVKESIGSIFPVVAPLKVNVKNKGEWNTLRVVLDWPVLRVWINDELVQDLHVDTHPELRYRMLSGYIGIESLSYPLRFRKLRLKTLPSPEIWETLYAKPEDIALWQPLDDKGKWETLGAVLRTDGSGYLATKQRYRDFNFQCYIRGSYHHNGGIIFRGNTTDTTKHYEIQLHDVEGAVYPTGSLYHYQRAIYPRIEPERWFPFQLWVRGQDCLVRINGDTVVDYHKLVFNEEAPIMLQAHAPGHWVEYKDLKIRKL